MSRRLALQLPQPVPGIGVVRQQHFVADAIDDTSHNSSAGLILQVPDQALVAGLPDSAAEELEAAAGTDPGLCMACGGDAALDRPAAFGLDTTRRVVIRARLWKRPAPAISADMAAPMTELSVPRHPSA